jgi:hypothetical protein
MTYDLDTKKGMANAVEWTAKLFAHMNEGGKWIVPRSGTLITVYPERKFAEIYEGELPDPSIERVIKAMGWNVYHVKDAHL